MMQSSTWNAEAKSTQQLIGKPGLHSKTLYQKKREFRDKNTAQHSRGKEKKATNPKTIKSIKK